VVEDVAVEHLGQHQEPHLRFDANICIAHDERLERLRCRRQAL
jgi:predicted secreted Zn-dependent protease